MTRCGHLRAVGFSLLPRLIRARIRARRLAPAWRSAQFGRAWRATHRHIARELVDEAMAFHVEERQRLRALLARLVDLLADDKRVRDADRAEVEELLAKLGIGGGPA